MNPAPTTVACALAAAISISGSAIAAENGKISVELNDLQQAESGCRAVFVLHNGLSQPLDDLALQIVSFDGDGRAKLFLSLDVGPLPIGKTRILRFDLGSDVACDDVSRIVLDEVTRCEGPEFDPQGCLAAVSLSSRASAPFDL